jgi:hypothetical protein
MNTIKISQSLRLRWVRDRLKFCRFFLRSTWFRNETVAGKTSTKQNVLNAFGEYIASALPPALDVTERLIGGKLPIGSADLSVSALRSIGGAQARKAGAL